MTATRRAIAAARIAYFVAAGLFVVFVAYIATRPVLWLVGFMPDDTFYYLETSRYLAAFGRSTFDGINPTNGYHPGWMLLLTGAALVFRKPETLLPPGWS